MGTSRALKAFFAAKIELREAKFDGFG